MKASVKWIDKMNFVGHSDSKCAVVMDAPEKVGGTGMSATPKELVLLGLGGCTAMDVVSILRKMSVVVDDFDITLDAEQSSEHPKVFTKILMTYHFTGEGLEAKRGSIEKAIKLSQDKYCGVSDMLKKACDIDYEIELKEKS